MDNYVDILGTHIEVGDIVAVGQRSGNSGALTAAIVLEKIIDEGTSNEYDEYKIRVLGGKLNKFTNKYTANTRHGDTYPDRVIVITSSIPNALEEVLLEKLKEYLKNKEDNDD